MKHILFKLKKCSDSTLDNEEHIRLGLYKAVEKASCKLIHLQVHKFEPQGVTGFAMLADSHISIHTWPEEDVAICDIFTCSDESCPEKAVEYLQEWMKASEIESQTITRSL